MQQVAQSSDLMRFISALALDVHGDVTLNVMDQEEPNFISRYFTPNLTVSELGVEINQKVRNNELEQTGKKLASTTLTAQLIDSDLSLTNPYMYKLSQSIILDAFSVVYAIEEEPELLEGIEAKDLRQTRTNIKYLIDYLGEKEAYTSIVLDLHDLSVAIGYIEYQLPLLRGETNG